MKAGKYKVPEKKTGDAVSLQGFSNKVEYLNTIT